MNAEINNIQKMINQLLKKISDENQTVKIVNEAKEQLQVLKNKERTLQYELDGIDNKHGYGDRR